MGLSQGAWEGLGPVLDVRLLLVCREAREASVAASVVTDGTEWGLAGGAFSGSFGGAGVSGAFSSCFARGGASPCSAHGGGVSGAFPCSGSFS